MITMTRQTLQDVMTDPAVDAALTQVATMAGVTTEMAAKIVASGLPLMANVADEDPWVFKAMFAQSLKPLPAPSAKTAAKLGPSAKAWQAMAADFINIYGPMTETITRDAAHAASATEQQASQVLAAMMPAMINAMGTANTNANEMGFGRLLRNLRV